MKKTVLFSLVLSVLLSTTWQTASGMQAARRFSSATNPLAAAYLAHLLGKHAEITAELREVTRQTTSIMNQQPPGHYRGPALEFLANRQTQLTAALRSVEHRLAADESTQTSRR